MNREALSFKPAASNRHPVDQLALIRETIKNLQERETELKVEVSEMMGTADSLGGDEYLCWRTRSARKGSLDQKALEQEFGDLSRFRKPDTEVLTFRVEKRAEEAA